MSSQAERIRAFKLAQHARLQKQDEEEPWISSEELCTEGSSDEETHTNVKSTHRKPKRNVKTEKRGISPLAQQPLKTRETGSTSTYQDSKYLSPDVCSIEDLSSTSDSKSKAEKAQEGIKMRGIDAKVERLSIRKPEAPRSSKDATSSSSSEDSDNIEEMDEVIVWRPKRGSIKLPEFPEGMQVEVTTVNTN